MRVLLGPWGAVLRVSTHQSSFSDAPVGGGGGPGGIGLDDPGHPAAREGQGIGTHGSSEGQPGQPAATSAGGIHHSCEKGEEGSSGQHGGPHSGPHPSLHPPLLLYLSLSLPIASPQPPLPSHYHSPRGLGQCTTDVPHVPGPLSLTGWEPQGTC